MSRRTFNDYAGEPYTVHICDVCEKTKDVSSPPENMGRGVDSSWEGGTGYNPGEFIDYCSRCKRDRDLPRPWFAEELRRRERDEAERNAYEAQQHLRDNPRPKKVFPHRQ